MSEYEQTEICTIVKRKDSFMNIHTIQKRIREEGLLKSARYYFNRILSKLSMHLVGRAAARFGEANPHRIVFKNREMQDFTDNPRALFEYLTENGYNETYQLIYMVSDKRKFKHCRQKNVKFVTAQSEGGLSSPAAFYYGATAKYFFFSHNSADLNRFHRKGQITVNLWHGCGYKGASLDNPNIPHSKTMAAFDYALVPGELFAASKSEGFGWPREKILCMGYPRYDWLLAKKPDRTEILSRLGLLPLHAKKIVIWMPTFRKSVLTGYGENEIELPYQLPALRSEQDLQELDRECKKRGILLLIKKHPLQIGWETDINLRQIRYITDEQISASGLVLYQLLRVCDALISDYSSVAVDYLLLNRPMAFVLTDYEMYKAARGFVFENPLAYMPGEKIYNFAQLKEFLAHVEQEIDPFAGSRQELLPQMHNRTQNYCRRLLEFLEIKKEMQ